MRLFALRIAVRYLLAKKRAFISFITTMAIGGVAIGVAALATIMGASSGLQTTITQKVVGVNAHVLVMTGGWEFERYEDVIRLARSIDGVTGAAPFVINERMLLKGARTHGILVKGVDPDRSSEVLDVAHQIARADGSAGTLTDLRATATTDRRVAERSARNRFLPAADAAVDGVSAGAARPVDPFPATRRAPLLPLDGLDRGLLDDPTAARPDVSAPPEPDSPADLDDIDRLLLGIPREPEADASGPKKGGPLGAAPAEPTPAARDEAPERGPESTRTAVFDPPPAGGAPPAQATGIPGEADATPAPSTDAPAADPLAPAGSDGAPPTGRPDLDPASPASADDLFDDDAYDPSLFGDRDPGEDDLAALLDEEGRQATEAPEASGALPGLILGRTLAEKLDVRCGDVVKIVSPSGGVGLGFGGEAAPSDASFQVVGIFYSGFNEYDSRLVYIHLREAQLLFQRGDTVTGVELRLDDLEKADRVADTLSGLLSAYDTVEGLQGIRGGLPGVGGSFAEDAPWSRFPSRRWLPARIAALATLPATLLAEADHRTSYRVITWKELNVNLFTALWIQKIFLTIVLAVVVGVAAFNIVSTLIMIVLEKKREIAILKSMGAQDRDVLTVFATVGTVVGVLGLSLGLGLGYALSSLLRAYGWPLDPKVYMIDHLPIDIRLFDYLLCAGIAFVICLVATLIPSWRAARMRPVDGLHYE